MLVIWEKIISFPSLRGLPYSFIPIQYLFPFCLCCPWFAWRQDLSWSWICSAQGTWGCPRSLGPRTSYSCRGSPHGYEQSECLGSHSHSSHGATIGYFLCQVLDINLVLLPQHSKELWIITPSFEGQSLSRSLLWLHCVSENMPWLFHSWFSNPYGFQSCCPPLASSPMTNTFLCVLDCLVMGGMQPGLGPFLDDGSMKWTQVTMGVIREGTWIHS